MWFIVILYYTFSVDKQINVAHINSHNENHEKNIVVLNNRTI